MAFVALFWIMNALCGASESVATCVLRYYLDADQVLWAIASLLWAPSGFVAPSWKIIVNHVRVFVAFEYLGFGRGTRLRPSRLDCHTCGSTYGNVNKRLLAVSPVLTTIPTHISNHISPHRGYPHLWCHPVTSQWCHGEEGKQAMDPVDVQTPYHGMPNSGEWAGANLEAQLLQARLEWERRAEVRKFPPAPSGTPWAPRHPPPADPADPRPPALREPNWEYTLSTAMASLRIPNDQDTHCVWVDVTSQAPSPTKLPEGMQIITSAVDYVEMDGSRGWRGSGQRFPVAALHRHLRSSALGLAASERPELRKHGLMMSRRKVYEHEQDDPVYGRNCGREVNCIDALGQSCPCHRVQVQTFEVYFTVKFRDSALPLRSMKMPMMMERTDAPEGGWLVPTAPVPCTGHIVAPGDFSLLCGLDFADEAAASERAAQKRLLLEQSRRVKGSRVTISALTLGPLPGMMIPELSHPSVVRTAPQNYRASEPHFVGRTRHPERGAMAPMYGLPYVTRHRAAQEEGVLRSCRVVFASFHLHHEALHGLPTLRSCPGAPTSAAEMTAAGSDWRRGVNMWRLGRSGSLENHAVSPYNGRHRRVFVEERGMLLPDGSILGPYGLGSERPTDQCVHRAIPRNKADRGFILPSALLSDGLVTNAKAALELSMNPSNSRNGDGSWEESGRRVNPLLKCRKVGGVVDRAVHGAAEGEMNLAREKQSWMETLNDFNVWGYLGEDPWVRKFGRHEWRDAGKAAAVLLRNFIDHDIPMDSEVSRGYEPRHTKEPSTWELVSASALAEAALIASETTRTLVRRVEKASDEMPDD
jgi:hypothetical protein